MAAKKKKQNPAFIDYEEEGVLNEPISNWTAGDLRNYWSVLSHKEFRVATWSPAKDNKLLNKMIDEFTSEMVAKMMHWWFENGKKEDLFHFNRFYTKRFQVFEGVRNYKWN